MSRPPVPPLRSRRWPRSRAAERWTHPRPARSPGYTTDSVWRNRDVFLTGRRRSRGSWSEVGQGAGLRPAQGVWDFGDDRIAVRLS
ncbi:DUF1348 family protein [Nonomuraea dietziae]|uniref:DUF1348 family protein n=1 Tax=Nonomuraea dietziae TaxID=65515 RepID=UPI003CD0548C